MRRIQTGVSAGVAESANDAEAKLIELAGEAWRAFDAAASFASVTRPSMPILFFGDFRRYLASRLRIVTVGLNPSDQEFLGGEPFQRFRGLAHDTARDPRSYIEALARYFSGDPHWDWFRHFRQLLAELDASYEADGSNQQLSTVLHTDICSPLATTPTWSKIEKRRILDTERESLISAGTQLWEELIRQLRPNVAIFSASRDLCQEHSFEPVGDWRTLHTVTTNQSGGLRRNGPYAISSRWHRIEDQRCLFVQCPNRIPPLQIGGMDKSTAGRKIKRLLSSGP